MVNLEAKQHMLKNMPMAYKKKDCEARQVESLGSLNKVRYVTFHYNLSIILCYYLQVSIATSDVIQEEHHIGKSTK